MAADSRAFDVARTAYEKGDADAALRALDRHARAFPRSQFAQAREKMFILMLKRLGRDAEAQARLECRRTSPKSALRTELQPLIEPSP